MKKYAGSLLLILVTWLSACTPLAAPTPATPTAALAVPSPTSTPLPPAIIMHAEIGCLSTPQDGILVATFQSGDTVPLVGKDDYGEYWVVIDPVSGSGCWIPREGTSSQGIVDYLPNLVPPPTPMPRKPAAPGNITAILESCGHGPNRFNRDWIPIVVVSWEDLSDDEDSFLIHRYGQVVGRASRDETSYRDSFTVTTNGEVNVIYAVNSYSRLGGESEPVEVKLHFVCK